MAEDPKQRQEIQLALKSIVESAERWLGRLRKREFQIRLASTFLTTVFAFLIVAISILFFVVARYGFTTLRSMFFQTPGVMAVRIGELVGLSLLAGLLSGAVTYFFLRSEQNARLKELSSLISEMKKVNSAGGAGITEGALLLAEKLVTLLPQLVQKRNQDSLVFGVLAFVIASFFGNIPVALLIGVIVWIYFRYEFRKNYEQEIAKFEEQKRVFEQRKIDFLETL